MATKVNIPGGRLLKLKVPIRKTHTPRHTLSPFLIEMKSRIKRYQTKKHYHFSGSFFFSPTFYHSSIGPLEAQQSKKGHQQAHNKKRNIHKIHPTFFLLLAHFYVQQHLSNFVQVVCSFTPKKKKFHQHLQVIYSRCV